MKAIMQNGYGTVVVMTVCSALLRMSGYISGQQMYPHTNTETPGTLQCAGT